jgi:hypothetical protein
MDEAFASQLVGGLCASGRALNVRRQPDSLPNGGGGDVQLKAREGNFSAALPGSSGYCLCSRWGMNSFKKSDAVIMPTR